MATVHEGPEEDMYNGMAAAVGGLARPPAPTGRASAVTLVRVKRRRDAEPLDALLVGGDGPVTSRDDSDDDGADGVRAAKRKGLAHDARAAVPVEPPVGIAELGRALGAVAVSGGRDAGPGSGSGAGADAGGDGGVEEGVDTARRAPVVAKRRKKRYVLNTPKTR